MRDSFTFTFSHAPSRVMNFLVKHVDNSNWMTWSTCSCWASHVGQLALIPWWRLRFYHKLNGNMGSSPTFYKSLQGFSFTNVELFYFHILTIGINCLIFKSYYRVWWHCNSLEYYHNIFEIIFDSSGPTGPFYLFLTHDQVQALY